MAQHVWWLDHGQRAAQHAPATPVAAGLSAPTRPIKRPKVLRKSLSGQVFGQVLVGPRSCPPIQQDKVSMSLLKLGGCLFLSSFEYLSWMSPERNALVVIRVEPSPRLEPECLARQVEIEIDLLLGSWQLRRIDYSLSTEKISAL
jgi:hypothetical protein